MLFTVVGADVRQRRRREPSNITSSSISTQPPNAASAGQLLLAKPKSDKQVVHHKAKHESGRSHH